MEEDIQKLVVEAISKSTLINKIEANLFIEDKKTGELMSVTFDIITSIKSVSLNGETENY